MRIIGLDLSLTSTGLADIDGSPMTLKPPKWVGLGPARWEWIWDEIFLVVDGRADMVMIEGYAHGRQYGREKMGEIGGIVRYGLFHHNVPYIEVPPPTLKKFATGVGNAGKEVVLVSAVRRLGYEGASNDEADALWLREIGLALYGHSKLTLPQSHMDALGKLKRWRAQ